VPILATDREGAAAWSGGLDPWGAPYVFPLPKPGDGDPGDPPPPPDGDRDGLTASGLEGQAGLSTIAGTDLFLRFPGQWEDPSFYSHGLQGGLYYNVHRWYTTSRGTYTRPDPAGLRAGGWAALNLLYAYASLNPLSTVDLIGLLATRHCTRDQVTRIETAIAKAASILDDPSNPCCRPKDDLHKVKQHLQSATYYCAANDPFLLAIAYGLPTGVCGGTRNDRGQEDKQSITLIVPLVFDDGQCGCLEGTLLHEASHNVLDTSDLSDTNNAYDFARACTPCALGR
jgi:RHS repeat-associated protein